MTNEQRRKRLLLQVALLIASLLILIGISIASIYLVYRVREDTQSIAHTLEVQKEISNNLLELRRAESAQRGYTLTGQQQLLDEYNTARSAIFPSYERLRQLTADNAKQRKWLEEVRPRLEERLSEFDAVVAHVRDGRREDALRIISQGSTRKHNVTVRTLMTEMYAEEERLLAQRTASADKNQVLSAIVATTGSSLVLILGAISILFIRRSERARDAAEQKLRDINVNLESAVAERTTDLREANEEIQRFAYIVSHDLRSPLVNIMGFTSELQELHDDIFRSRIAGDGAIDASSAETISSDAVNARLSGDDKRLSDEFIESVGFIKSSIGKMDRLIHAILQLTREGRREFRPERVDMKAFLEGIVSTVAHQAAEADATITVQDVPDLTSDRLALEQVFSNLIDNALKYLRTGVPGDIRIRGRRKLGFIIYEVSDNGRGIDEKDHQRIFDLFRRAGVQDKPGQGIGLAHVRALVRRMGGTLSVSSEPGQGSTFTVTLPEKWTLGTEGKKV